MGKLKEMISDIDVLRQDNINLREKVNKLEAKIKVQSKKNREWTHKYYNEVARNERLTKGTVSKKELEVLQVMHDGRLVEINELKRTIRKLEAKLKRVGAK